MRTGPSDDSRCGGGRTGGEAVALDIQEGMLERLRKRIDAAGLKNIQPILGGIGQVEIESNSFDRALLVTVLGEIPDREAALQEIYRVLNQAVFYPSPKFFLTPIIKPAPRCGPCAKAQDFS